MELGVKQKLIKGLESSGLKCEYMGSLIVCHRNGKIIVSIPPKELQDGGEKINISVLNNGYYVNSDNLRQILTQIKREIKVL